MQQRYPRQIILLCSLSGVSCLTYTILVMSFYQNSVFEKWIELSRPAISIVYSMLPARTDLRSDETISAIGKILDPMVYSYGFSWIIGFSFFVPTFLLSIVELKNYYVAVSLPAYPKNKPIIEHIAWKWIGTIGCWVAAAYGGELDNLYLRIFFASLFIPLTFCFVLEFIASLLAHFRFKELKGRRLPR